MDAGLSHYQNYALLCLISNLRITARQGYDIYSLQTDDHTIHDVVNFALARLRISQH